MANLQVVITADRQAVGAFVAAARRVPPTQWALPRAVGKWSPGQVTEHVALAYEQSRRMLLGTFTGPVQPSVLQLLARWIFLRLMFKRGDFGKAAVAPEFIQPSVPGDRLEALNGATSTNAGGFENGRHRRRGRGRALGVLQQHGTTIVRLCLQ